MIRNGPLPTPPVFKIHGLCDSGPQHDITLITDGVRGYGFGTCVDTSLGCRTADVVEVACLQPVPMGRYVEDDCDGYVRFTLDPKFLTDDEMTIESLALYGEDMDDADND